jgi:type VI secretion system protein ImpH
MPGETRPAELDLKRKMLEEGYLFDFFRLVHLLETWLGRPVPLGRGGPFRAEGLRLQPDPSLVFSPADVRRVEEPAAADQGEEKHRPVPWQYRIVVNFMGLYGVASPTPVYLTELIGFTDVDAGELTDFLDLFNHRILSLFYRAWLKYRYPWRYEPGGLDEVSGHLLSFIGLADPAVRARTGLPTSRLLRYLGLLSLHTRPPVGLKLMVSDHFGGVQTRVEERIFRWVTIPPEGRNRLGAANSTLGVDLSVGERVPDRAGKFRLSIGPLLFAEYLGFLPDRAKFREACLLSRLWVGERFDYDVELVVRRDEIPEMQMAEGSVARLGWTSWVTSSPGLTADPHIVFAGARLAGKTGETAA